MNTEHKVTEIFCITDDFCKVFDAQMAKFSFKAERKRKYQRESSTSSKGFLWMAYNLSRNSSNMKGALMSVSDKLLLRKRAIIETVNDELKNIAQVEHSRHRSFDNCVVNLLGGIAAYCYFPKKPTIRVQTVDSSNDRQLTLF